ncbi:putative pectinesterase [Helianthus annuus]|uniref:Pectinesterase n=1 Tax=Helianthus annuus TaxID=4232 RepID=A0A251U0T8_HELAN|nr:pectinesterase [Helianthus annuus]KAF5793484.1 putative pectinesterase [Helianthus annuus]
MMTQIKARKKLLLTAFASILLVSALIGIVIGVKSRNSSGSDESHPQSMTASTSHAIVKSSCDSTFYPELCYSTITSHPEVTKKVKSQKDVIELAVNITKTAVEKNYFQIKKMSTRKGLTPREIGALHDCLEMVAETLEELTEVEKDLEEYHTKKSLQQHANDLKTLMSSTITDQETCLDGFSHGGADKKVRKELEKGQVKVEKMCSNALAMICNMTDTDIANEKRLTGRNLKENNSDSEWPEWLSVGDRKLLQAGTVTPNVVVAADGSGDHKTVAAAVAAAPSKSSTRYVIRIKAGVYRENVEVPKGKTNLMFIGDGRKNTIITASRSVKGGSTTFESATVAIVGDGFLARDITFQNTAGASNHQAVALRVGSDLSAFYQCDMLAYQDTLYVHKNRQFYINCLIAGTVDFIFGNAAAVFQDCDIHARRPNSGQRNMLTAQGRTDSNQNTGIVIQKCRIGATSDLQPVQSSFPTYLGRPWKQFSRTVVMQSTISNVIHPAGWFEWDGNFALDTLYYAEYQNTGAGAGTSGRVKWKGFKVITSSTEAQGFTPGSFIGGGSWLRSTGFPFSLGL